MKLYIGADPGASGSLAFLPQSGDPWAVKMPETHRDLLEYLQTIEKGDWECYAFLEEVSARPTDGRASMWKFASGYGALQMAFIAAGIPFEKVRPQVWQKELKCLTGGNKAISKARAQELFPQLKITHAIADGLLIALYGKRTRP